MNVDSIEHRLMHIEDDIKRLLYMVEHQGKTLCKVEETLVEIQASLTRVVGISVIPGPPVPSH